MCNYVFSLSLCVCVANLLMRGMRRTEALLEGSCMLGHEWCASGFLGPGQICPKGWSLDYSYIMQPAGLSHRTSNCHCGSWVCVFLGVVSILFFILALHVGVSSDVVLSEWGNRLNAVSPDGITKPAFNHAKEKRVRTSVHKRVCAPVRSRCWKWLKKKIRRRR